MFYDYFFVINSILAVVGSLLALRMLLRGAWICRISGLFCLVVSGLLLSAALALKDFSEYTAGKPIALISFSEIGPRRYHAVLIVEDVPREFILRGDFWQLQAHQLRWGGWCQRLGSKPGYQLVSLNSTYSRKRETPQSLHSVYPLVSTSEGMPDVWRWLYTASRLTPGVTADSAETVEVPMADSALFQIFLEESGLVASPLNEQAKNAVNVW